MKRFNLLITPVGGIVVVVVMALSAVAGIVANFVSNQQSDLPAQTADSVADFRRSAEQSSGNIGAAADIPPFELKPTEAAEPDALIWWDATPEPVAMAPTAVPQPTATPVQQVVYVVVTPTPTPVAVQQVLYIVATSNMPPPSPPLPAFSGNGQPVRGGTGAYFGTDGIVYVSTPIGEMPCSEIYMEWGSKDARAQQRDYLPWFDWFESIGPQQRLAYLHKCDQVVVMPRGDND